MVFRQRKPYDPEKAHSHAPVHLPEVEGQLFQSLSFLTSSSLNARARSSERLRDSAHFAVATRSYALAATPQLAAPPRGRWDLGPGEPRRAELRRGARRGRGAEGRGEEARGRAAEGREGRGREVRGGAAEGVGGRELQLLAPPLASSSRSSFLRFASSSRSGHTLLRLQSIRGAADRSR